MLERLYMKYNKFTKLLKFCEEEDIIIIHIDKSKDIHGNIQYVIQGVKDNKCFIRRERKVFGREERIIKDIVEMVENKETVCTH